MSAPFSGLGEGPVPGASPAHQAALSGCTKSPCLAFEAFVGRAAWRHPRLRYQRRKRRPAPAGPLWAAARDMCWTRAFQAWSCHTKAGKEGGTKGFFTGQLKSRRLVPACCAGRAGAGGAGCSPEPLDTASQPKSLLPGSQREPHDARAHPSAPAQNSSWSPVHTKPLNPVPCVCWCLTLAHCPVLTILHHLPVPE